MNELKTLTQTIKGEIDLMNAEFEAKKKELTAGLQAKLAELTKVAFEENPRLRAICWTQYTPYFNDGEPCEFRMGEINALVLDDEVAEAIEEGDTIEDILSENYYEGNIPYGMHNAPLYRTYLETGEVDFSSTYYANSYYADWTEERKLNALFAEWLPKYPQSDETSLARFDKDLSAFIQAQEVTRALSNIPDEIMEELFGDHVRVVITKDGIDVAEYEHD